MKAYSGPALSGFKWSTAKMQYSPNLIEISQFLKVIALFIQVFMIPAHTYPGRRLIILDLYRGTAVTNYVSLNVFGQIKGEQQM